MARGRTVLCNYTSIKDDSGVNSSQWSPILSFKDHMAPGRNGIHDTCVVRTMYVKIGAMSYFKKAAQFHLKTFVQIMLRRGTIKAEKGQ